MEEDPEYKQKLREQAKAIYHKKKLKKRQRRN